MALRAGSLFDEEEVRTIRSQVQDDILLKETTEHSSGKPTTVTNDNPLAIWLNYLLYHLSMTRPGRERASKIEPDPFSLSLLALERLAKDLTIGKIDRSARPLSEIRFKVAMSFPGERRPYVGEVVNALRPSLGTDAIFYDYDYQAQLARPNLDTLLQGIYRNQSELVVIFLCAEYANKQWCGLESRAVRDIIKSKEDDRIISESHSHSPNPLSPPMQGEWGVEPKEGSCNSRTTAAEYRRSPEVLLAEGTGGITPDKLRPRNPRNRLIAVTGFRLLWTFPQTGPVSPFIADADHRALTADHKLPLALSISWSTNYSGALSTATPAMVSR